MAGNWYPRYPGDYIRDTAHLTLEEHGAYTLLMDHYYMTGCALPVDIHKLSRILRVSTRKTRSLMLELGRYFDEKDGKLFHKKIEFELDKSMKKHRTAVANGRAGGKATAMAKAQATVVATTTTTTVLPNGNTTGESEPAGSNEPSRFDEFWTNYPRKTNRKKAEVAFNRLSKTKQQKAIDDCKVRFDGIEKQYIPHATTYIHGERWDDELIKPDPKKSIKFPDKGDCQGWTKFAADHGLKPGYGELQVDFERRVRNHVLESDD